jgi:hypothetical protein
MHLHTPHITKGGKRKASIDSVVVEDEAPTEQKITKSKRKTRKTKQPKVKTDQEHTVSKTPEEPQPQPQSDPSLSPSRTASPVISRKDSMQEAYAHLTVCTEHDSTNPALRHDDPTSVDAHTQTEETTTPRRSSRIKNSMHSVANTWDKCRPYLERINGTIMPLEPQGTKAYYARDGVKVD